MHAHSHWHGHGSHIAETSQYTWLQHHGKVQRGSDGAVSGCPETDSNATSKTSVTPPAITKNACSVQIFRNVDSCFLMASSCSDMGCLFGFDELGESIESTIESILCNPAPRKNDSHAPDTLFFPFLALHLVSLRDLTLPGPMQPFHCNRVSLKLAENSFLATCCKCVRKTDFEDMSIFGSLDIVRQSLCACAARG